MFSLLVIMWSVTVVCFAIIFQNVGVIVDTLEDFDFVFNLIGVDDFDGHVHFVVPSPPVNWTVTAFAKKTLFLTPAEAKTTLTNSLAIVALTQSGFARIRTHFKQKKQSIKWL